jgi:galactokinase
MKFEEAIATSSCMFCKPLLWSEYDKRDQEAEKALYHLKKMKRDKSKDKDIKYVEKLLYYKSRMF